LGNIGSRGGEVVETPTVVNNIKTKQHNTTQHKKKKKKKTKKKKKKNQIRINQNQSESNQNRNKPN
jgi:hypothetical protein